MKIESKFNIGEDVWFIYNNAAVRKTIQSIIFPTITSTVIYISI